MLARIAVVFPIQQPYAVQGICILIMLHYVTGIVFQPQAAGNISQAYIWSKAGVLSTTAGKNKDSLWKKQGWDTFAPFTRYLFLPVSYICNAPTHPFLPTQPKPGQ